MTSPIVTVSNLTKNYGSFMAVKGISFDVYKGEVFGLLGPNGAGKTTTLECLEGMKTFDGGTISVVGCDPATDEKRLRKAIGVQLQSSSLPESMNSAEAMLLFCAWHGLPPRYDLLDRFGLEGLTKKLYHTMSVGQKRRLHLALSLACDPDVVILDEPTAGLDVQGKARLHDSIRQLKSAGVTILLATHDMAEAESLCDRIAIMIKGRIATLGTPAQITAAGSKETKITVRTTKNSMLPGKDMTHARFVSEADGYGLWMCTDTASAVMEILQGIQQAEDIVEDLRVERPSLEERFLELAEGGSKS